MRKNKSGSTIILEIVCAIIFVIFSIKYIFLFQGDILGMMQYSWSDHETHYDRIIGGCIIFALLLIITYLVSLFFRFSDKFMVMVYMPAMILMGQITAVEVNDSGEVYMSWHPAWISILLLLCYPMLLRCLNKINFSTVLPIDAQRSIRWLSNCTVMFIMMVLTYSIGNTDRNLHTRLALERLCHEGKNAEALETGIPQYDHGSGITMWRAFALSHSGLGEKLFTYNIDEKTTTLLPRIGGEPHTLLYDSYPIWQTIGFVPRNINEDAAVYLKRELRRHTARPAAKDYLLCTYLIRRDLGSFAAALPQYYDVKTSGQTSLPQHYKEALVMYYSDPQKQSQMLRDSVALDSAMIEDYEDFQGMMRAHQKLTTKEAALRDNYFGTYWYYYYRKE